MAATVAKAPAAKAHLQRTTSSATPATPSAKHTVVPAKRAHAKVTVVSTPHGVAFVHNRVTDENIGAAAAAPPAAVPEAQAPRALAPPAEQPVAYAAARPAPTTAPVVPENAKEHNTFDRGLSTASTPTPAVSAPAPTPADISAGREHDGTRDHGKRNDRTDRHDSLKSSTPAPATAAVTPVTPATAQPATPQPAPTAPTDRGKARWKQNDKRDDHRSNQPSPPATTPAPASPSETPTPAPPVAAEPAAPMPGDHGRKWKDAPAPVTAPATPAAAPAPAPSEDKASHRDRGWRR